MPDPVVDSNRDAASAGVIPQVREFADVFDSGGFGQGLIP